MDPLETLSKLFQNPAREGNDIPRMLKATSPAPGGSAVSGGRLGAKRSRSRAGAMPSAGVRAALPGTARSRRLSQSFIPSRSRVVATGQRGDWQP